MGLLDDMEEAEMHSAQEADLVSERKGREIVKAAFGWVGGKSKSIEAIGPHLPYREAYCEVFGGSGAIMLSRLPSKLEIFNDRNSGVVSFYRVMRDPSKLQRFMDLLDLSPYSKEEFWAFHDTWKNCQDDVERAFRWFYMVKTSFGALGRDWGRCLRGSTLVRKITNVIPMFPVIHERVKNWQVENLDWIDCLKQYDQPGMVWYLDPPYLDTDSAAYKDRFTVDDHRALLQMIPQLRGFVALSGYPNALYDGCKFWDDRLCWKVQASIQSIHRPAGIDKTAEECLWIRR